MVQFPIILLVIITGTPPSLKMLLLFTSLLFLNQLITARGLPVAAQAMDTLAGEVTDTLASIVMLGITVGKE